MLLTENLEVFKKAHKITLMIYELASAFPKEEKYGLSSQMKRAAVSINSNIMEGNARKTDGERKQFLGIARGSAAELQYQIMLAKDLKMIDVKISEEMMDELKQINRMLSKLMELDIK